MMDGRFVRVVRIPASRLLNPCTALFFRLETIFVTELHSVFQVFVAALLMLFHRLAMVDPKLVTADTTPEMKFCTTVFTAVVSDVHAVDAAVLMFVHRVDSIVPRLVMKFVTPVTSPDTRLVIVVLMVVQIVLAVVLMPVQIAEAVSAIPVNNVEKCVTMPSTTEENIPLMPSQIVLAASLMLFQMFCASELSCSKSPVTRSMSSNTGARIVFFRSSHAPAAMVVIPSQIPDRVFFRFSHRPLMVDVIADRTGLFIIPVQIPEKKSLIPCHNPDHQAGMP